MKESRFEKPACSAKNAPSPAEIECQKCGSEMEIWSDEDEILCRSCGEVIHAKINNEEKKEEYVNG